MENKNKENREEQGWSAWIRDKVLPPLIVAFICVSAGGGVSAYRKLDAVAVALQQQAETNKILDARLTKAESEIVVIRSQMVGWDVLKRIEQSLSLLAANGESNKGVKAIANSLQVELQSRKEFSNH
jgi:hypothetical protein